MLYLILCLVGLALTAPLTWWAFYNLGRVRALEGYFRAD